MTAGGKLLLELNRLLRPGGYFVWSATPVYRKGPEDAGIWKGRVPVGLFYGSLARNGVLRLMLTALCF